MDKPKKALQTKAKSQKSLEVFFQEEIFDPLQMVDTGFNVTESNTFIHLFPITVCLNLLVADNKHRLAPCYQVAPGQGYVESTVQERNRDDNAELKSGGGGLVSTISDYFKFCNCLNNNGIVEKVGILKYQYYHY